jgi:hypothetical protein
MIIERRHILSKTYLQHLHKHINDVSDRIIRPGAKRFRHLCPDLGKNTENDIFKLNFPKHRKSMVSAQQAVLSCRNCPEDFQMVMPFVSNDDDANDDIKSISSTCSSQAWILSIDIRQELNRQIKVQTRYSNSRRSFSDPNPSFPRDGIT